MNLLGDYTIGVFEPVATLLVSPETFRVFLVSLLLDYSPSELSLDPPFLVDSHSHRSGAISPGQGKSSPSSGYSARSAAR